MDNHHHIIGTLGRVIVFVFLVSSLPGCSLLLPRETVRTVHDTTTVHHRDSIHFRDSIYIREWMKGDTVYVDRFRDRYVYRDRWRDSVSIREVHDTTTVERKVEKALSKWQKARIDAFWWLALGLAACLAWIFRKPIFAIVKKIF